MSLIELLIVVSIIGILLTVVTPKYLHMIATAKQSQVKTDLYHIHNLMTIFSEGQSFEQAALYDKQNPNWIGFESAPDYLYTYTLAAPLTQTEFLVLGQTTSLCGNELGLDIWSIDQDLTILHLDDGLEDC